MKADPKIAFFFKLKYNLLSIHIRLDNIRFRT